MKKSRKSVKEIEKMMGGKRMGGGESFTKVCDL